MTSLYIKLVIVVVLAGIAGWYIVYLPSVVEEYKKNNLVAEAKDTVRVEVQEKEAFKVKRRLNEVTVDSCESNCTKWL